MEAQKIYEEIKSNKIFQGLEIVFHTQPNGIGQIRIAFGQAGTEQVRQASEILGALGFRISLFGAMKRIAPNTPSLREQYEAMTPDQKAAADELWEKMARS